MPKTADKRNQTGAPAGYDELREFFPTPSLRARALGVKRDTIQVWDQHMAARLRGSSQGRVTLLLALCSAVSRHMLSPRDVGQWMLTPQPSLRGRSPVYLLRQLGDGAYEQLRTLVSADEDRLALHTPLTEQDWETIEAELDPVVAQEIRSTYERVTKRAVPAEIDVYDMV